MRFEVKKVDNCFVDSLSFEYRLPVDGQQFSSLLTGWEVKENHKFRRPLFTADNNGVNVKGILKANVIKVSYPQESWEKDKEEFETRLELL